MARARRPRWRRPPSEVVPKAAARRAPGTLPDRGAHEGVVGCVDLVGVQVVAHDDVGDAERLERCRQVTLRPGVGDCLLDGVEQAQGAGGCDGDLRARHPRRRVEHLDRLVDRCGPRSAPRSRRRAARAPGSGPAGRRGRPTASPPLLGMSSKPPRRSQRTTGRRAVRGQHQRRPRPPRRTRRDEAPDGRRRRPSEPGHGERHEGADAQAEREPHERVELVDVAQGREGGVEGVQPRVATAPTRPIRRSRPSGPRARRGRDITSTRRSHSPGCRRPTSPIAATSTVGRAAAPTMQRARSHPSQPIGPPPGKNATQWLVPRSEDSQPVAPAVLARGLDEVQERR